MDFLTFRNAGRASTAWLLTIVVAVASLPATAQIAPGQVPQIPAFLPSAGSVPKSGPMPIDGTWTISSIGKRVRIEEGRIYAVDPWLHMFVLQVQPGMVVIQNLRPTGPGTYTGDDLPLLGTLQATVNRDGAMDVSVASVFGPVNYQLLPVELDDRQWHTQEMQRAGITPTETQAEFQYQFASRDGSESPPVTPVSTPPAYAAPPATDPAPVPEESSPGATRCKDVVYREETDDFECVQ